MTLSPGDYLGPYRIIHLLGSGGMGEVYRAHDSRLERDVALKIMRRSSDAEHVARFSREARAAGSLNHPNIVAVYDVGEEGGMPYVVTELLEGETLRARLNRTPLPYRKAVEHGTQIAQALDAVHAKGIWHRDVKPGNVFVTNDGRVKLLDFGVAKLSEQHHFSQAETVTADDSRTGEVRGTPGYMSPEQVLGNEIDHRTDIFALGIILYEMFTGARAFQRNSTIETMNAVLQADPADPLKLKPDLAPVAAALVRRCLEKNREDRFQSARDLAFDLQQLRDQSVTTGQRVDPPVRKRVKRLLAVAAAAGLVGLAVWLLWPTAPPSFEQLTFSRGRIGGARFASDGVAVVYSEAREGRALQVSRIDLADRPSFRPLNFGPGTDVLAARAGDLAVLLNPRFVQGERFVGTLGVAPLGGAANSRADNIEHADWSRAGELAVVRSSLSVGGRSQIEYPLENVLYATDTASLRFLRVSPDGKHVAFLEGPGDRRSPSGVVSVVDREGNVTKLTQLWDSVRGLAWSPSGREVWFAAAEPRENRTLRAVTLNKSVRVVWQAPGSLTLWDIAEDGRVLLTLDDERKAVVALAPGEKTERDLSWFDLAGVAAISRDGKSILGGDRFGVYRRPTDGSDPVRILSEAWADDLSTDGKTILATTESGKLTLVPPVGAPRPLPDHGIVRYSGAWLFPDGHRVLFTGQREGQHQRSYVQEIEGGAPRPLTPEGTWGVSISQDGQWIAVIGSGPGIAIWPVSGEGQPRLLSGSQEGDRPVAWNENGKSLWVFRRGEIPAHVYTLDTTTGRRQPWKPLSPPDSAGVYSIIDFLITPSGNAYAYSYTRLLSQLYLARGLK